MIQPASTSQPVLELSFYHQLEPACLSLLNL